MHIKDTYVRKIKFNHNEIIGIFVLIFFIYLSVKFLLWCIKDNPMDCYSEPMYTQNSSGYPSVGDTFSCNASIYKISYYDENLSKKFLGGWFPMSHRMKHLGCSLENDLIICNRTLIFNNEERAYRNIVAKKIK